MKESYLKATQSRLGRRAALGDLGSMLWCCYNRSARAQARLPALQGALLAYSSAQVTVMSSVLWLWYAHLGVLMLDCLFARLLACLRVCTLACCCTVA